MLRKFNGTLGVPFCPTKGKVLQGPKGFTDADNDKMLRAICETCDSFGVTPTPNTSANLDAAFAIGDPGIAVTLTQKGQLSVTEKPVSCTSCAWFVPANVVGNDLGYNAPMCSAKGRLLFPKNLVREAANCGTGLVGDNRTHCDGILLHKPYQKMAPIKMPDPVVVDLVIEANKHSVDPREYVTDRPVTPEDEERCIRAWREVVDPEGIHESVFMPIFDGEKLYGFDPRTTYGGHRPDLYVDHAGLLYDLACELFRLHETPLLIGGAGTGKTETSCWLAWLMDLTNTRIDIKKGTEPWHFIGESKLETDPVTGTPVTKFHKGRFAEQYDKPGITMVNEPNLVSDIFEFLRPVFDNADQLGLDEAQGEIVSRHRDRYILCSQNPSDDPLYVGTEPLSAADIDRVSPMFIDLPPEPIERQIITAHCADDGYDIPPQIHDKIMQVAHDLRAMIADGTLPIAWGLRAQIKVARKTRYYSFEKAYRRAVIDGMEASVIDQIMKSVRSAA
jgi:hypothetical protein